MNTITSAYVCGTRRVRWDHLTSDYPISDFSAENKERLGLVIDSGGFHTLYSLRRTRDTASRPAGNKCDLAHTNSRSSSCTCRPVERCRSCPRNSPGAKLGSYKNSGNMGLRKCRRKRYGGASLTTGTGDQ